MSSTLLAAPVEFTAITRGSLVMRPAQRAERPRPDEEHSRAERTKTRAPTHGLKVPVTRAMKPMKPICFSETSASRSANGMSSREDVGSRRRALRAPPNRHQKRSSRARPGHRIRPSFSPNLRRLARALTYTLFSLLPTFLRTSSEYSSSNGPARRLQSIQGSGWWGRLR
jgi:hypothetical protein